MATFVAGDLQGCLDPLKTLLDKIEFDPKLDKLWLAGDLINRGPQSLETLRFVKSLDDQYHCVKTVLGNHDLHLLACAYTGKKTKSSDTIQEIIEASDADELLNWLRQQPLAHFEHNTLMIHAGLHPEWPTEKVISLSQEVEAKLQSNSYLEYFENMYGNTPENWDDQLTGMDRLRVITNVLTRIRYCYQDGRLDLNLKTAPDNKQNTMLRPWFDYYPKPENLKIVFGHWASLQGKCPIENIFALDTGCVWGGCLTLLKLEDNTLYRCQCS